MLSWENLPYIDASSFKRTRLATMDAEQISSDNLKVLLIEDDDADAYLISTALAGNPRVGELVWARDGVQALEFVDSGRVRPDLAILDLHMPRKDGFALLLEFGVRESVTFPSIVLTSSRSGPDALRSRIRGAAMYLVKPGTPGAFTVLMDGVIATL